MNAKGRRETGFVNGRLRGRPAGGSVSPVTPEPHRKPARRRRETGLEPILSHGKWGLIVVPVLSACVFGSLFLSPMVRAWRLDAGGGSELLGFAAVRFAFWTAGLGMWVVALGIVVPFFVEIGVRRALDPTAARERALWFGALAVTAAGAFFLVCLAFSAVVMAKETGASDPAPAAGAAGAEGPPSTGSQ